MSLRPMLLSGNVIGTWYGIGIGCFSGFGFLFCPQSKTLNGGTFHGGFGICGGTGWFFGTGIGFTVGNVFASGYELRLKK
jgi:hypothetical protein